MICQIKRKTLFLTAELIWNDFQNLEPHRTHVGSVGSKVPVRVTDIPVLADLQQMLAEQWGTTALCDQAGEVCTALSHTNEAQACLRVFVENPIR